MKIWEAKVADEAFAEQAAGVPVGNVCMVEKEAIYVQTGKGVLKLTSVQLEGKKRMNVKEFLLGYQVKPGELLGKE